MKAHKASLGAATGGGLTAVLLYVVNNPGPIVHWLDLARHEFISATAWEAVKTNIGANLWWVPVVAIASYVLIPKVRAWVNGHFAAIHARHDAVAKAIADLHVKHDAVAQSLTDLHAKVDAAAPPAP